jgi:class 3 adenylate cyclase/tetratricopeptide (TPR) repeat protein
MASCPNCAEPNPARARFCLNCGHALTAPRPGSESRKTVTLLFADLCGSTTLGELLDAESFSRLMANYYETARAVLERHGATVQKFIGDAVMAVFGIPVMREDDALRAVRAAAELSPGLVTLSDELQREWGVALQVRIGLNTGEVIAGSPGMGSALVVGDAVNVAARLEQAAGPGEILLGQPTWRLVRDAVTVERLPALTLKGKESGVPAYRLGAVRPGVPGHVRRGDAALVGRREERALIDSVYQRMLRSGSAQLVTVLGPAGVGKSRLVTEALGAHAPEALVLHGGCLSYGEGITYRPVAEIVRQAAGIGDADEEPQARDRIGALLADDDEGIDERLTERLAQLAATTAVTMPAEEIAWTVRSLLERLARRRPVVAVLDDLHWAEPALVDLVDQLVERARETPLLFVTVARPELLDRRPTWGGGKVNSASMLLEPLDQAEADQLLAELLPSGRLAPSARARLTEAAGGNPLFLQELLAMLIEDGIIAEREGAWLLAADEVTVAIPPTIQALLGARLDHLDPGPRSVLEHASIVGQVFDRESVEALAGPEGREGTGAALAELVRKELVGARGGPIDEGDFEFRHLLLRDVVYASVPKKLRAELHERFAEWLAGHDGDDGEPDELVGYHLEQAYQASTALHPVTERDRKLGARAAERLATAGRLALDGGNMQAAVKLLIRATALLGEDDPARVELLPDLGHALTELGEADRAGVVIDEAIERAAAAGDDRTGAYAQLERVRLLAGVKPEGWAEEARREANRLMPRFEELGDERGQARALSLLASTLRYWRQLKACEEAAGRARVLAERAGDDQEAAISMGLYLQATLDGPVPVTEGVARCEQILATLAGRRRVEGQALFVLAGLKAMQGEFAAARELLVRSRTLLEELGTRLLSAEHARVSGEVELLAGNPAGAERELRRGRALLERLTHDSDRAMLGALLARAVQAQGRLEEAEELLDETSKQIAMDDFAARITWGAARSSLLVAQGRAMEAEILGGMVVELARDTDAIVAHAGALLDQAAVLEASGRPDEASGLATEARTLAERKGDVVLAGQAGAMLARLTEPA